jgi:hypothetical protein
MKIADFEVATVTFLKNHILPETKEGLERIGVSTAIALLGLKFDTMLQKYIPVAQQLGVVDAEGDVDINTLELAVKEGLKSQPKIPLFGFNMDESDVIKYFEHLRSVAN